MTRAVVEWGSLIALTVVVLLAVAGCARPPGNYLCRAVTLTAGETALFCVPTLATPKDGGA